MKLNCSETLGFQLRTLAEQRDAEVGRFVVSDPFVEANTAEVLLKTNGLANKKYGYPRCADLCVDICLEILRYHSNK